MAKMAQNGQKMAEFWKFLFHRFSHPKTTPETGTSHFHATLHSKDNFSSRISNFSNSNFGRSKKQTGEVKIYFFSNLFYRHFIKKLKNLLEPFFLKVQKTLIFSKFYLHKKFHAFYQKSGCVAIHPLPIPPPNFPQNFRKILGAVFEIIRDEWTHGHTDGQTCF